MHMRELWGQKLGLAIALVLAILATARVGYGASLFPPQLHPDTIDVASASTHVLIDTPRSSVTDLRQTTYSFTELTNRALLLGNVMASFPVREYIARHADVPPTLIRVAPPLTPDQPRALADTAHQPKSSDILKSPDEYRINIHASPIVPVLDVYTEAPTVAAATKLANGAVEGLRDYLRVLADQRDTPLADQVRLVQLGRASGGAVNPGANLQLAVLVFFFTFALCCAAVLFIARVRRGWAASGYPDDGSVGQPG